MPHKFTSPTQKTGEIGEDLAVRYLEQNGYKIIERNYTRKWGEIDIIAEKDDTVYFFEVKSKTAEKVKGVSREIIDQHTPEEHVHPIKIERLMRAIQTYMNEKQWDKEWRLQVLAVILGREDKAAVIRTTDLLEPQ